MKTRLTYRDRNRIKLSKLVLKLDKKLKSKILKMSKEEIIDDMPEIYSEYCLKHNEQYADQQHDLVHKIFNIKICLDYSDTKIKQRTIKEELVFI